MPRRQVAAHHGAAGPGPVTPLTVTFRPNPVLSTRLRSASHPLVVKPFRSPSRGKPRVSIPSSRDSTLALLSRIQATRRSRLTASRTAPQFCRSVSAGDDPAAAGDAAAGGALTGAGDSAGAVGGLALAVLALAGFAFAVLAVGGPALAVVASAGFVLAGLVLARAALSGGLAAFRSGGGGTRVRSEKSFVPECGGGGGEAGSGAGVPRPPDSSRSSRASSDFSSVLAAGSRTCAQASSSSSRGDVAPRIWSRPVLTISAARASPAWTRCAALP